MRLGHSCCCAHVHLAAAPGTLLLPRFGELAVQTFCYELQDRIYRVSALLLQLYTVQEKGAFRVTGGWVIWSGSTNLHSSLQFAFAAAQDSKQCPPVTVGDQFGHPAHDQLLSL